MARQLSRRRTAIRVRYRVVLEAGLLGCRWVLAATVSAVCVFSGRAAYLWELPMMLTPRGDAAGGTGPAWMMSLEFGSGTPGPLVVARDDVEQGWRWGA